MITTLYILAAICVIYVAGGLLIHLLNGVIAVLLPVFKFVLIIGAFGGILYYLALISNGTIHV